MKRNHVERDDKSLRNVLKLWTLTAITIWYLIYLILKNKDAIDLAMVNFSSFILTDKAFGTTIGILLFSFVAYRIFQISKKQS